MDYQMLIASTNEGKIKEITNRLHSIEGLKINIASLEDYPTIPEPDEPFNNLMENAIYKSKYYAVCINALTLSEDSGLFIEALNGFPGVKTKDLIEECGGLSQAFSKLESLLSGHRDYTGYFSTAVALYIPSYDFLISHRAQALDGLIRNFQTKK
ncbi:MAG: non-canonical purine NTP pyrophosphatase [Gammaproteobacteria bacterium]|nr:non-canonical purine NTP pyrophosphatase [Gammaproteobacteria bacterium]MBP9728973.1 non-canonical purine NTP pyrophosphatase [Gammaproteobacteria bacterium]